MERELTRMKEFAPLGIRIVSDYGLADITIWVDRPLFTYAFTYSVTDSRTSVVLHTGKVAAFDGNAAAAIIARQVVEEWTKVRTASDPGKK